MQKPTTDEILDRAYEPEIANFYKDLLRGVSHPPIPELVELEVEQGGGLEPDLNGVTEEIKERSTKYPHLRLIKNS